MHNIVRDLDKLRGVVGTLCHNSTFTATDIAAYTRFEVDGSAVVRVLLRLGYIQRVKRGMYYPTVTGWNWIEESALDPLVDQVIQQMEGNG